MKTALIQADDRMKSIIRFYEVKHKTTIAIDPDCMFDGNGYAVLYKSLEDAVLHVRKIMAAHYLDGLTDPKEKAEAMKYIGDFYRIVI